VIGNAKNLLTVKPTTGTAQAIQHSPRMTARTCVLSLCENITPNTKEKSATPMYKHVATKANTIRGFTTDGRDAGGRR
jgi:uncharacterized protein (DUF3084 family)